ncbi:MAG: permease-like cell division protein FtsX [Patescibacteria group bacterium]
MMRSIVRITKYAFQNFFRNFWLTIATLIVILIFLTLVNVVVCITYLKSATLEAFSERIDISLDFKQSITELDVLTVKDGLKKNESIESIEIITPDDNLLSFQSRYPKLAEKIIPVLSANPLGYSLIVRAREIDDYASILDSIESDSSITDLLYATPQLLDTRAITQTLATVIEKINQIASGFAVIFFFIAIVIIFNSIRVSIYTHREEIGIMRLVGATNTFIRLPFMLEAALYSIVALTLMTFLTVVSLPFVDSFLNTKIFAGFTTIDISGFYAMHYFEVFGVQLLGMIVLTAASTSYALRRYLKV